MSGYNKVISIHIFSRMSKCYPRSSAQKRYYYEPLSYVPLRFFGLRTWGGGEGDGLVGIRMTTKRQQRVV